MKMKKVFKLWWGWNPGRMEKYLEDMAADGWRLATVSFVQMLLGFIPDEPRKTSYCIDYQNNPSAEYLTMIYDDGWELVDKSAGWLMWRKNYEGAKPKIYTDNQSLLDRNKRLLAVLIIAALLQLPLLTMVLIDYDFTEHLALTITIFAVYLPLLALMVLGIIRIIMVNRILKSGKR